METGQLPPDVIRHIASFCDDRDSLLALNILDTKTHNAFTNTSKKETTSAVFKEYLKERNDVQDKMTRKYGVLERHNIYTNISYLFAIGSIYTGNPQLVLYTTLFTGLMEAGIYAILGPYSPTKSWGIKEFK